MNNKSNNEGNANSNEFRSNRNQFPRVGETSRTSPWQYHMQNEGPLPYSSNYLIPNNKDCQGVGNGNVQRVEGNNGNREPPKNQIYNIYYNVRPTEQELQVLLYNSSMNEMAYHKCPQCEKRFKRKSWLKRHMLSHSEERQYSCPWCISRHKRKDNLLQHMKLKHTDEVLKKLKMTCYLEGDDGEEMMNRDNIRTMLYEGLLDKDEVKKVLNELLEE
ncbi:hypothetical protein TBLA_0G02230 [Henningerozyma blattae CBS 6284]|uniref:C2H2-type domain-containing protein n=1 Tax=Henningerozyma blattae (strain ATCC 34711 / CBS 6284 / DSM 70876 / NBRC 10599 / NRRL Y-10934 / UCD 77-7) TaxID=1071380 RepID=I2H711_HENB6|nr:hypothetical protein TBLA_0G02230 [Tetrapisispora blattae CBS 6284]CCH62163.1 hypothetical protein TBLA_0G02230 [Tetrapisispora blattae CBS 6284]